jgi:hypothetical protein
MCTKMTKLVPLSLVDQTNKSVPLSSEKMNEFLKSNHMEIWNTQIIPDEDALKAKFTALQIKHMSGSIHEFRQKSFFIAMDIGYSADENMFQTELSHRYGINVSQQPKNHIVNPGPGRMPIFTWQVVVQCHRYLVIGKLGLDVCHQVPTPSMISVVVRETYRETLISLSEAGGTSISLIGRRLLPIPSRDMPITSQWKDLFHTHG